MIHPDRRVWLPPREIIPGSRCYLVGGSRAAAMGAAGRGVGGGTPSPDVAFLSAVSVAASDGATTITALSASFTPHASADFVLCGMTGRQAATGVTGSAMSLNGVSMGAALSTDDGAGANAVTAHIFGASSFAAGTLAYTRSAGSYLNARLWGMSFQFVASVGTPVKASGTASPAQAAATPAAIGDMLVVMVIVENTPTADNQLTPINCTERLDLLCPDDTPAERTIMGIGTLAADVVASETLGFSFAGTGDRWRAHVIPLQKAP
jgi:hypothetical protein